jgi:heme exporter protein A
MQACRLSARDLACRRGDRVLFAGLSFALEPGQALQVTGANGIGKSSLIRILAGLLRPYAGTVEREGPVGLLDERLALDEHRPLGTALKFWGRIDGETTLVHDAPGLLGLSDLLDVPVRYLSTGQRKRAALARLTGQRAAIWLLDEPLNGLDAHAIELFEELVEDHCTAGGIAVIASHQPFGSHRLTRLALADYAA